MNWMHSLHGTWEFSLDPKGVGLNENWQERHFNDTIPIPGILQAQGYGEPVCETTPWVSSLHDRLWFQRDEYRMTSAEVNIPFLSQPPRHYLGSAWYGKTFQIPPHLAGCLFYLNIQCVKWKTLVWVDGEYKGTVTKLCTPHNHLLGELAEGEHHLTVLIDNGLMHPYRPDGHMVSDALGAAWNGMAGDVSVEAVPPIHIKSLRIFPDTEGKKAGVEVHLFNPNKDKEQVEVQVNGHSQKLIIEKEAHTLFFELDYPKDAKEWDGFDNNLHQVQASLSYDHFVQEKTDSFGFRKIEARDGRFYVNGRPAYFRGTHFGGDFPLTGYPWTETGPWQRLFRILKDWGLNYVRFHSFCPPEAAFAAADGEGVFLQAECGMWNVFYEGCSMNEVLWEETESLLDAFGNHPSFVMLSPSNEPGGDWYRPLASWVERCRRHDSRRLYTVQSGWPYPMAPESIEGTDYVYFHRSGFGIKPGGTIRGSVGWHGGDYALSVENIRYPVISHELGQWCSYPDFDVISKFTGYLKPGNYKVFKESAGRNGVLNMNKKFALLSGKWKAQLYKEDIEATFRTPHIYGFELLDLHDYVGQGTALVGLLDPFWDEKGFIAAREFRSFCSETVPLIRLYKRVYTSRDSLDCPVSFYHFGKNEIRDGVLIWKITDESGRAVKEGTLGTWVLPIQRSIEIGSLKQELNELPAPGAYDIIIGLQNTSVKNSWRIWLYEEEEEAAPPANVVITRSFKKALEALNQGEKVIYMPYPEHHRLDSPPLSVKTSFWNSQMGPTYSRGMGLAVEKEHPALALFPTDAHQDWQWEEIVRGAHGLNLSGFPEELVPIVQPIDDWNRNYRLSMILECRALKGALLIVTADLCHDLETRPAARLLKKSLMAYAASPVFNPETEVAEEVLKKAFFPRHIMKEYGVKARLIQDGEVDLTSLLDGNPNTFVSGPHFRYPFTLMLESERKIVLKGVLYMPRQNEREHKGDIKGCRVEAWLEGMWKTVYEGELTSSFAPKELLFCEAVTTGRIRFTARYGFSAKGVSFFTQTKEGWFSHTLDHEDQEGAIGELMYIPLNLDGAFEGEEESSDKRSADTLMEESRGSKTATQEIDN